MKKLKLCKTIFVRKNGKIQFNGFFEFIAIIERKVSFASTRQSCDFLSYSMRFQLFVNVNSDTSELFTIFPCVLPDKK